MKQTKKPLKHILVTAVAVVGTAAYAVTQQFPIPPLGGSIDTESSVTMPFSGWDAKTRHFELTFEVARTNTEAYCIQCAFGTDVNADGDLAPEETDLIVGYDCGVWFVSPVDAAPSPRQTEVENSLFQRDEGVASTAATFELYPFLDRNWNAVKVTTRGRVVPDVSIAARFRTNVTVIVIR